MLWVLGMVLIGLSAGMLSGLFGIGGGIMVVPALVFFWGMEQKMAQGTTLLMMLPPIGLLAAMEYWKRGQADWHAALWICIGFIAGGLIGAKVVGGMSTLCLRRVFAVILVLVGVRMFFKQ